jgi:putative SOS response-associated peptidase YedK
MCGRLTMTVSRRTFETQLEVQAPLDFRSSANVAPRTNLPILRGQPVSSELLPWGFRMDWSKGDLINARSETVLEKYTFRDDLLERRVVVVCSGWLEWSKSKQPYHLTVDGSDMLTLAGFVHPTPEGERVIILTTSAQPEVAHLHDRMPVILTPDAWRRWLEPLERGELEGMLEPSEHELAWWAVDQRLGNANCDDPSLLRPLEAVGA